MESTNEEANSTASNIIPNKRKLPSNTGHEAPMAKQLKYTKPGNPSCACYNTFIQINDVGSLLAGYLGVDCTSKLLVLLLLRSVLNFTVVFDTKIKQYDQMLLMTHHTESKDWSREYMALDATDMMENFRIRLSALMKLSRALAIMEAEQKWMVTNDPATNLSRFKLP
ncbi:hypothetical protein PENANT_c001G11838 [Penicillium antarcticum]|uniref:Uncharacterized protein n=1 Tax=Penicillium antarcticum TaxID=416450 RepID=A0A1V6QNG0_9EURO|nr:hypothetical protein PENANT_c001G11838 [Penicillium antarcticum]